MSLAMERPIVSLRWMMALGLSALMSVGLVLGLTAPQVQAASPAITLRAWLDNNCIAGTAPRGSAVKVTWKNSAGSLKKLAKVRANKKGKWSVCHAARVQPGDRLTAKVGKASRTARVPRLDLEIDRDADTVSGVTTPGKRLIVQHCWWSEVYKNTRCDHIGVTVASNGRFSVDMNRSVTSNGDILGGDRIAVFMIGGPNLFGRDQLAPYVNVLLGSSGLTGAYTPGASLTVHLLDGNSDPKAEWSGTASRYSRVWSGVYGGWIRIVGLFKGTFVPDGQPVAAGDRVASSALPPTPGLPVLDINVSGDAATDVVTGSCATKNLFQLSAINPNGAKHTYPWATTGGQDGQFTRDMTGKLNLVQGSVVSLTCQHWTGDQVTVKDVVD